MLQSLGLEQEVIYTVDRRRGFEQKLKLTGRYNVDHMRGGLLIAQYEIFNDITNEGKNLLFDVFFNATAALTTWYIGLISLASFSALAAADTLASHSGWVEFTSYSQANRVSWGSGAASSQSITNASAATFDMTGSGTVKGIFIPSNNTKGGTTGKLWSTALFTADVPVVNGDQLKITYTLNA